MSSDRNACASRSQRRHSIAASRADDSNGSGRQHAHICFTARAINSLMEHYWPGKRLRESSENLVERMLSLYPNSLQIANHLPTKYRYRDIPEFQPEFNSFVSEEEQERDALADLFSEDFSWTNKTISPITQMHLKSCLPEGVNLKELPR
ncbi:hypothetical protein O9993_02265 [Vibrio lentus]|nr:hypothetical protein [Vibrio lentus]